MGQVIDLIERLKARELAKVQHEEALIWVDKSSAKIERTALREFDRLGGVNYAELTEDVKAQYEAKVIAFMRILLLSLPAVNQIIEDRLMKYKYGRSLEESQAMTFILRLLSHMIEKE
jgi:hypothetical protein